MRTTNSAWWQTCFGLVLVGGTYTTAARADEARAQCANAYETGQEARRDGKFAQAAERLVACSQPKCGEAIARECTTLYAKLQEAMPSVAFGVHDDNEQDLVDVTVSIDGQVVQDKIDGHAVTLDPGVHTFRFVSQNYPPVEKVIAIREGEKFRLIDATLIDPHAAPAAGPAVAPVSTVGGGSSSSEVEPASRKIPVPSMVLGGVGVAALATFGYFRLSGNSEFTTLKDTCAPRCTESDVSGVRDKFVVSNVAVGVGLASLAAGALYWVLQPSTPAQQPATAWSVQPIAGGGAAAWRTTF